MLKRWIGMKGMGLKKDKDEGEERGEYGMKTLEHFYKG